ncbi:E3 ubiquitin-protein ligase RNF13 [Mus pahari]|uniref:E3 ubiquitin-protein ligase RNF13 n=1 Tax=Mus pahari TaxID=10093 RepID=UPI000A31261E|nr:E3 ubiquitin-protein ligase RNF13 [Mus pahari]
MLLSIGMLMLSATQVYTILTVQLFAFLNLLPVEADILAYNFENASQTFEDLPARFGYRLPAEGLKGFLINSKPENACEPIVPPPLKDNSSSTFIVLIRRLDCNFDIKVLNAQRAGYKAAIVHNVDSDDLISMGSNDIDTLKKIDIPSVFIGESSANSLKDEFTYEKGGHIVLVPELSLPLEYYLIPFLIIVGICLILIVIFMVSQLTSSRHKSTIGRAKNH